MVLSVESAFHRVPVDLQFHDLSARGEVESMWNLETMDSSFIEFFPSVTSCEGRAVYVNVARGRHNPAGRRDKRVAAEKCNGNIASLTIGVLISGTHASISPSDRETRIPKSAN